MKQEEINKLYDISISCNFDEFKNNIELFRMFSRNSFSIRTLGEKEFEIIKFILNNQEYFENEYFVSTLVDTIKYAQERVSWQISQSKEPSIEDLDVIINEINKYKELCKIFNNPNFSVNNVINQSSINAYLSSDIYVYYIDSLMKILSSNYLTLSKDKIDMIMDLIYNNGWLNNLLEGKIKNSMLNRDLINKYIQRILTIKEFVSSESITDDKLVSSITSYKIKDPKLLSNLISYLSPTKLVSIFDYKVDKLVEFIVNADYMNDDKKGSLLFMVIDKFLNEDYYEYLLEFLQSDVINNSFVSIIFDEKIKNTIIKYALNDSMMSWKNVYFLLEQGILDRNFISNAMAMFGASKGRVKKEVLDEGILSEEDYNITIDFNDTDIEKISKMEIYNMAGRVVDYNISLELLKKYFSGQVSLSIESMKAITRSIIIEYLDRNGINDVGVLFDNLQNMNGSFNEIDNRKYISISIRQINKFLDNSLKLEDRLSLFITVFHEMRHAIKNNNINNNKFDYDTYFMLKEKIIREYDQDYYSSNYRLILEEIDARQDGCDGTMNFFESNFPGLYSLVSNALLGKFENYSYVDFNEKKFSVTNKKEYVSLIFDKIMILHPELLEKFPVLNLEYNLDGSVKKLDEMVLYVGYDKELQDQIINKRYPIIGSSTIKR